MIICCTPSAKPGNPLWRAFISADLAFCTGATAINRVMEPRLRSSGRAIPVQNKSTQNPRMILEYWKIGYTCNMEHSEKQELSGAVTHAAYPGASQLATRDKEILLV
jgi:hypothetical protein